MDEQDLLRVGVITSAHGIKGEVSVFVTTDEPEMFRVWKTLVLRDRNGYTEKNVENVKYFRQMVILKLEGVEDRNQAELLRKAELWIHRSQAAPCGEYENFIADLIGLACVTEDGEKLGDCADVLQTGANDVYIIRREGQKELLIPAVRQVVLKVDLPARTMTVRLPEGLAEIYR